MANRLSKEKSPYLLQHKDNPVNWYPLSNEAFQHVRTAGASGFTAADYTSLQN